MLLELASTFATRFTSTGHIFRLFESGDEELSLTPTDLKNRLQVCLSSVLYKFFQ